MIFFKRTRQEIKKKPVIVVFAGGMGTQILQTANYYALKDSGVEVWADLSYFDTEAYNAKVGEKGKASHRSWQLEKYGIHKNNFKVINSKNSLRSRILYDGLEMTQRGLNALKTPEYKNIFKPINSIISDISEFIPSEPFLCIHVRRGDYLNVASHLVSDAEFLSIGEKFSGLVNSAVLLSDSPFTEELKSELDKMFSSVRYLDRLDPFIAHWLMRHASILICSNSSFSLTAAMLNPKGLIVMPKQWFGENDRKLETPIHNLCRFQIMS